MTMTALATDTMQVQGNFVIISQETYDKLLTAQKNDDYRRKLEHSLEQSKQGKVITKTMEELEAMEN